MRNIIKNQERVIEGMMWEEILKYRRERYRTIQKKDLNIKVSTGTFTLYFDSSIFMYLYYYYYIIVILTYLFIIMLESKRKWKRKRWRLSPKVFI